MSAATSSGRAWIGISGYDYPNWKDRFYPPGLRRREWLTHASRVFDSIELNGTFYSLKSPAVFARWKSEVPDRGFVFAIKGSRFITHNLKLRRAEGALANFLASGVLALGTTTGPFLWQLPTSYAFDAERMDTFMSLLPRTSSAAALLSERHDDRLKRGALTTAAVPMAYRHAFEVRHVSYLCEEFYALLRRHGHGFVIADTAGTFAYAEEVTAPFVYVRLHGSRQLYVSGYTPEELDSWAVRIETWVRAGLDVYVYFDNDARVHAPFDAIELRQRVDRRLADDAGRVPAQTTRGQD
jgi:uncharacterized protein YecE (DUF72 family)